MPACALWGRSQRTQRTQVPVALLHSASSLKWGKKNSKQTHVILDNSVHVSPFVFNFSLPDLVECECAFLFFEFQKCLVFSVSDGCFGERRVKKKQKKSFFKSMKTVSLTPCSDRNPAGISQANRWI